MQHEIAAAEREVRSVEDRILDRMEEARRSRRTSRRSKRRWRARARRGERREAQLERQRAAMEEQNRPRGRRAPGDRRAGLAEALAIFESVSRKRNGVAVVEARGRTLHRLQRAAAAAAIPRDSPQRQPLPVRQLSADPLLCRAGGRRGPFARRGMIRAYIDGGARGNPGPRASASGSRMPTAPSSPSCTSLSASPRTTSRSTRACWPRCATRSSTITACARPIGLAPAGEADAGRVQGEERGSQAAGGPARLLIMSSTR